MFGLTTIQLAAGALLLYGFGSLVWQNRALVTGLRFPFFQSKPDPAKAFEHIQALKAYFLSVGCKAGADHISEAGKCLFDHDHEAPEAVA